jgi:hypothetical protein
MPPRPWGRSSMTSEMRTQETPLPHQGTRLTWSAQASQLRTVRSWRPVGLGIHGRHELSAGFISHGRLPPKPVLLGQGDTSAPIAARWRRSSDWA